MNGLPLRLAKGDAVLLVYLPGSNAEQMTSTQLLFHFGMAYLPSIPKQYLAIVDQKIPYEREKLRKLKEVWQLSLRARNPH